MAKSMSDYVTAAEACALLDIKRASLYSYASRGLVRSVPREGTRSRLYLRSDVLRLRTRHDARAGHGAVAAGALRWGEAVLDSSITEIVTRGPRYRGHDAVDLARAHVSFERVAELLWGGALLADDVRFVSPKNANAILASVPSKQGTYESFAGLVLAARGKDADRAILEPTVEISRARSLVAVAACLPLRMRGLNAKSTNSTVARAVLEAWGRRPTNSHVDAINQALVLLADHELSASAFAARVVASTGADLYTCLEGGLAACFGPLHGGECDRVENLLDGVRTTSAARRIVRERRRDATHVPGFSHRLYPDGDPRASVLLETAEGIGSTSRMLPVKALASAMRDSGGDPPTVDLGLVALSRALVLPRGAAAYLFALGRMAGWVAHVLEQRETNALVRPRARFVPRRGREEGA